MTTQPLSVTPAERIAAQQIAYRLALRRDKWGTNNESLFLMSPTEMTKLFYELAELREFKAKHTNK